MDYSNFEFNTELKKLQWDAVHEPALITGLFEGDENGMGKGVFSPDPFVIMLHVFDKLGLQLGASHYLEKTFAHSLQAKAAIGLGPLFGTGYQGSISYASDRYLNMALVGAHGGFADLFSGLISTGENITRGSFQIGGVLSLSVSFDVLTGYETVVDIIGPSVSNDYYGSATGELFPSFIKKPIILTPGLSVDIGTIYGEDNLFKGFSIALGFGWGIGHGGIKTNSSIFAFGFKDMAICNAVNTRINNDLNQYENNANYSNLKVACSSFDVKQGFITIKKEITAINRDGASVVLNSYDYFTYKRDGKSIIAKNVFIPKTQKK